MSHVIDLIIGGANVGSAVNRPKYVTFDYEGGVTINLEGAAVERFWDEFLTQRTGSQLYLQIVQQMQAQQQAQQQETKGAVKISDIRNPSADEE